MGGQIVLTEIGFCLDDDAGRLAVTQYLAEQAARDLHRRPVVKPARENHAVRVWVRTRK